MSASRGCGTKLCSCRYRELTEEVLWLIKTVRQLERIRVAPNHVLTVGRDREVNVELMGSERHGHAVELPAV